MNVDKAKKRIAKQVKKGDKGYPKITIAYFGQTTHLATEVVISFTEAEGVAAQSQNFVCETDVREDETIQSVLVKIMERANANTVSEVAGVALL